MVGQSVDSGHCFQQFAAMHPGVALIIGEETGEQVMYDHGKQLSFERLERISGDGPRWHLDFNELVAQQLVLASSGVNGEGAPASFAFADPTVSVQTGWYAAKVKSTVYESDVLIQDGKELLSENIITTEARRAKEAMMKHIAQVVYGTGLPAKNSFGGLQGAIGDGLTTALRQAAYTDRNGTWDDSAYRYYGATLDRQDSAYANHRSYVKPWTTTIPTVPAMCDKVELVMLSTAGNPNNILMGLTNYQTQRNSMDTTGGNIITQLDINKQKLGIKGFSYRDVNFIADRDIDLYCPLVMFGIDPRDFRLHMKKGVGFKPYKRTDVLENALFSEIVAYMQLTCVRSRTNIKWTQY